MQTISASDTGNQLISKLNSNFQEVSPSTSRTVFIQMARGGLSASTGLPEGSITTPATFTHKLHSVDYIHIDGTLESVTISSGVVSICCFNSSYSFLGVASGTTLISNTEYIRISVSGSTAYATIPQLSLAVSGSVSFSKTDHVKKTATFFCFETVIPKFAGIDENYTGSQGVHFDQGFVKLPPNYTPNGTPVPLVIYCPGSNGYQWGETSVLLYDALFDFICDNGYAMACCSGLTDYWMNAENNPYYNDAYCKKNGKWSGTVASATVALYEYVTQSYNVQKDGVYIFGKSSGGMGTAWLATMQPFKVRCAGLLAPTTFMSGSDMRYGFVSLNVLKQWNLMLGCPNYDDFTSTAKIAANSADSAMLVTNAPYYKQWEPFSVMSDIDLSALLTECAKVEYNTYARNAAVSSLINDKEKMCHAPMKIWQSQDDEVIPWGTTNLFATTVQNNNGICEVRQMPNNTGGHHSVDTDANAPKVNYTTKYNGVVNIPVAYAELVDWFNRW